MNINCGKEGRKVTLNDIDIEEVKKEVTISIIKANIGAMLITIPIVVILGMNYFKNKNILDMFREDVTMGRLGIFLVSIFLLIYVHELLHGLIWGLFCEDRKSVKVGFMKEYLTPYCHCKEWLFCWQYILGSIAPLVFLGILPCVISFFVQDFLLFMLSQMMIMAAGGDLCIVLLMIRKIPLSAVVKDHPSKCGCYALNSYKSWDIHVFYRRIGKEYSQGIRRTKN